jgi:hypothetical protein
MPLLAGSSSAEPQMLSNAAPNRSISRGLSRYSDPVLGFVAGFVTYQKSRRWCTVCGATLSCAPCRAGRAA